MEDTQNCLSEVYLNLLPRCLPRKNSSYNLMSWLVTILRRFKMSNDWILLSVRFVPSPFSKEKESCESKVKTLHPEISASHWGAAKSLQETMSSQVDYDSKESKVERQGSQAKNRVPRGKQIMAQKCRLSACSLDFLADQTTYQVLSQQKRSESWYFHPVMFASLWSACLPGESSWLMVSTPSLENFHLRKA